MQYFEGIGMENVHGIDSMNSGMTDGTHLSLQPQMDATFASQTTRTARKIITSEYQVQSLKISIKRDLTHEFWSLHFLNINFLFRVEPI